MPLEPVAPLSTVDLTPKDRLPVILSFLEDARRIIESGKMRRWEVFKWTFALNLLIASATFAEVERKRAEDKDRPEKALFYSGVFVSFFAVAIAMSLK